MNPIGIPNLDKNLEATLLADMAKVELLLRSHIEGEYPLVIETSRHLVEAGKALKATFNINCCAIW
jgi:heptaprenyl diphosphate synthase